MVKYRIRSLGYGLDLCRPINRSQPHSQDSVKFSDLTVSQPGNW